MCHNSAIGLSNVNLNVPTSPEVNCLGYLPFNVHDDIEFRKVGVFVCCEPDMILLAY